MIFSTTRSTPKYVLAYRSAVVYVLEKVIAKSLVASFFGTQCTVAFNMAFFSLTFDRQ